MATYYEMLIKGNDELIRAYLKGYLAGRGVSSGFLFSRDHPVELHHLRELIRFHGEVAHLVCEAKLRQTVTAALKRGAKDFEFELKETQKIKGASFDFDYKTANRDVGRTVKRLLSSSPTGVTIEKKKHDETERPGAAGAEAYAPLHDYELGGKGTVSGDPFSVLRLREKFADNTAFRVEPVKIHH